MKAWNEAEARSMLESGRSYTLIATIYGTTTTTVRCRLDPEYAALRRDRTNTVRRIRQRNDEHTTEIRYRPPAEEDVAARLAEIPPDTRSLTARILGDPLPGRSALYRRPSSSANKVGG